MGIDPPLLAYREKIPDFRANLFPSADVNSVRRRLTFLSDGVKLEVELGAKNVFCLRFSNNSCSCRFFCPLNPHTVHGKGFAMGATTKSITGLFANVCGRNVCDRMVREQIAAGHGTRSAATQGYLTLSLSWLGHFSWLNEARDQARWLLKRGHHVLMVGGQPSSAPFNSSETANLSGILSPARCPAGSRPQAVECLRTGVKRFHG